MAEMGFQPSDETDIGSLFPTDVKLTATDFTTGIVFDDESHELDAEDQTTNNNNYSTARKRTKEFFRRYIDDVYNGKVGKLASNVNVRENVTSRAWLLLLKCSNNNKLIT